MSGVSSGAGWLLAFSLRRRELNHGGIVAVVYPVSNVAVLLAVRKVSGSNPVPP